MNIEKVTAWRTSDGVYHSGPKMAEQHIRNKRLADALQEIMDDKTDAQDVLNFLTGRRVEVVQFLAACDAMEKEALES